MDFLGRHYLMMAMTCIESKVSVNRVESRNHITVS